MSGSTRRTAVRAGAIAVQWLFLTIGLGSLVMRSDTSYSDVLSPHLGAAPMFVGAAVAGLLLGLTVESPKLLIPLVLLLCLGAASFVGVLAYAPVADGLLVRTNVLDNFVTQRVVIVSVVLGMGALPAGLGGNMLGASLDFRQEILPRPEDIEDAREVPWWERRRDQSDERGHTS